MTNQEIVGKLWNLCNVLRDDGITYHQYVTELTYILFLKMAKETGVESQIPPEYHWDQLVSKSGIALKQYYKELLDHLGAKATGRVRAIYNGASSNIDEPKNLEKLVQDIDKLDWFTAKEEGLGNLYEGLLEKNANEKKSGAGQYFTPRVLIDVITELVNPQAGELCNDPACGTFGFMIAADRHIKNATDELFTLTLEEQEFQKTQAFTGCELVHETHRLALMNAMLHNIEGNIRLDDTLSGSGEEMKGFDVVLANPPFGTKKGGERASREDFLHKTSDKQLNFLQHIYRSLKSNGKARAGVVLPDNVLFSDGVGSKIRDDLMEKCNLHTILRLPTGIFYAQGVKTNVLFFTRGTTDYGNTKEVWVYDMRTNMPKFGKRTPLTKAHFEGFIKAYHAENRHEVDDPRFCFTSRIEIAEENNNLDFTSMVDDSVVNFADLRDPVDSGEAMLAQLGQAMDLIQSVVLELKELEDGD